MCTDAAAVLQVSRPYEVAEFDIMYGDGINNLGCLVDVGKDLGVLEARVSTPHCCGDRAANGFWAVWSLGANCDYMPTAVWVL